MKEILRGSGGRKVYVRERSSCLCTFVFKDFYSVELDKASIQTLEMSIREAETGEVINNRLNVSVKDNNGGTLSDAGVLELILDPDDNIIIGPATMREIERHFIEFRWTWNNENEVELTGAKTYELQICGSAY